MIGLRLVLEGVEGCSGNCQTLCSYLSLRTEKLGKAERVGRKLFCAKDC